MTELKFINGDTFPQIGLGTWLSKPHEVFDAVLVAIQTGYRHIDCAYIYRNEKEIGNALQYAFKNGWVKREELFITSKLWNSDHHPSRVQKAIERTLSDLQIDYLDLYLMHWPIAFKPGIEQAKTANDLATLDEIPLEVTWVEMHKLRQSGLTKHIRVSNFSISKLKHFINTTGIVPENNQVEIHPYFQQNEMLDFCISNNILLTAYAPLGSRHLMNTEMGIDVNPVIKRIAENHNTSTSSIILAWGMSRGTIVIPKSVNQKRIIDNFNSTKVSLSISEIEEINQINQNLRQSKGLYAVLPEGYYTYENIWNT